MSRAHKRVLATRRRPFQCFFNTLSWVVALTCLASFVLVTVWLASLATDDVVVSVNNVSVSAREVAVGIVGALQPLQTNTSDMPVRCEDLGLHCPETLTGVQTAAIACGAIAGNGLLVLFCYWGFCPPRKGDTTRLYPEL